MGKYFGTDGIRGTVGEWPMTVDFTLKLASAAARVLAPEGKAIVIAPNRTGVWARTEGTPFGTEISEFAQTERQRRFFGFQSIRSTP